MGVVRELIPPAQQELIAALEGLLDQVESGEVVGLTWVALRKNEGHSTGLSGLDENLRANELVYGLNVLLFRILRHQLEDVG